ncbi:NAD(P)H-binding protein [Neobacillus sp. Marseille-QA0830]
MVTGATGGYGSYALKYLKEFRPDAKIFALVRNEEKGKPLAEQGFTIRVADYNNLDSMIKALEGIDRLLFVSISIPNVQKNVVEAAKMNGIKYIAYTSLHGLEYSKFGLEINHSQTEEWIKSSGIPYTFLRNNWYLEIIAPFLSAAAKTKEFPYYSREGKLAWALKREYAEAGARVIAEGGFEPVLELTGEPYNFKELASAIADITEQSIYIHETDKNTFVNTISKTDITELGLMLATSYQDYALKGNNGENKANPSTFERVLRHPLTPLKEAIKGLI